MSHYRYYINQKTAVYYIVNNLKYYQFKQNTNILAIVGYGTHEIFGAKKVVIWNMDQNRPLQTIQL